MLKLDELQVGMASTAAGCLEGELGGRRWSNKDDWKTSATASSFMLQKGNMQVHHKRGIQMPGVFPFSFLLVSACRLCQWCHIFMLIHIFICF